MSDTIGQRVGRAEGPDKVTGRAVYPADVKLEGTLVGKCLRSPHAYAKILSIDTSRAAEMPGVHCVLIAADIDNRKVGRMLRDLPILADGVVRFVGQKVAAVAADSIEAAEAALAEIDVAYEPLEPVLDVDAAVAADAPVLHPEFETYAGRVEDPRDHANLVARGTWGRGDVEAGERESDHVFEHTFETQHQHQGYIEPHATTVMVDDENRVQVWVNSKGPWQVRTQLAAGIGCEESGVRVNPAVIGGDFGGKGGFMDTHIAYHLARATGRPVRVTMSYTEELTAGNPRHPARMTFRTGVRSDGTIVFRAALLRFDSGGYAAFKPGKGISYGPRCLGPYRMEHASVDSRMIYTNHIPCGSMRSPGDPQSVFAGEAQMDVIARELGFTPTEFRRRNLVQEGDVSAIGHPWRDLTIGRIFEACVDSAGLEGERPAVPGRLIGRGLALCERPTGGGASTARLSIDATGRVLLATPLRDTGSGFYTMLRQVVGRELGVAYDAIDMRPMTTDEVPFDGGVGGARITNAAGNAALGAASQVRQQLIEYAAQRHGWALDAIELRDGALCMGDEVWPLAALMAAHGGEMTVEYVHEVTPDPGLTVFSAQAAEVAVDPQTGQVEVLKITSTHDVGTIINPISHQGQIDGSIMQGIGAALIEGLQYDGGQVINANLGDYKLPSMGDVPEIVTVLVEDSKPGPTPYGGKAIGEQAISAVAPAIHNAVLDAIGHSMAKLPIMAEAVWERLQG